MKVCSKCKETKEFSEFNKSTASKDGYQYICKECKSELNKNKKRSRAKFGYFTKLAKIKSTKRNSLIAQYGIDLVEAIESIPPEPDYVYGVYQHES